MIDQCANRCIGRIDIEGVSCHLDRLGHRANIQHEIPAHHILNIESDIANRDPLESFLLYADLVESGLQPRNTVHASAIRSGMNAGAGILAHHFDARSGHKRARLVGDRARKRRTSGLGETQLAGGNEQHHNN